MSSNSQSGASFASLIGAAIDSLTRYHATLGARENINFDFALEQSTPDEADSTREAASNASEQVNDSPATDLTANENRNIVDILMNVTEGGFFAKDLLNGYASSFLGSNSTEEGIADKFVTIYQEPGSASATTVLLGTNPSADGGCTEGADQAASIREAIASNEGGVPVHSAVINTDVATPDRITSPHLSAILLDDTRISPSTRDADAVALFSNMIPPVQMSMCAPFLDLRFFYNTMATTDDKERTNNPTLIRFLGFGGTEEYKARDMTKIGVIPNLPLDPEELAKHEFDETLNTASAGMELFTAPQTLVNPNINNSSQHAGAPAPILDPFKPFMTLLGIDTEISGAGQALYAYEKANVRIMLHDRSRLQDIAQLVSPDLFGFTTCTLEYGWHHPNGDIFSGDPIGKFLHHLRVKKEYTVTSSSYRIQDDGQVLINLTLSVRGGEMARAVPVVSGNRVPASFIKPVVEKIIDESLSSVNPGMLPEVRQSLTVNIGDLNTSNMVNLQETDTLSNMLGSIRGTLSGEDAMSVEDVAAGIDEILTAAREGTNTAATEIETRCSTWGKSEAEGQKFSDPWLTDAVSIKLPGVSGAEGETGPFRQTGGGGAKNYVSLGKVIMQCVGLPLASTRTYEDVQVLFYSFNSQAAAMAGRSIARMPLEVAGARSVLVDAIASNPGLTVAAAFRKISSHVGDIAHAAYGLADASASTATAEGEEEEPVQNEIRSELSSRIATIQAARGIAAPPEFKKPNIKIMFEAVPAQLVKSGNERLLDFDQVKAYPNGATVLRVHVFDSHSSPYEGPKFLQKVMNGREFAALASEVTVTTDRPDEAAGGDVSKDQATDGATQGSLSYALQMAEQLSAIRTVQTSAEGADGEADPSFNIYMMEGGAEVLKKIVKGMMPSITMGESATNVTSISVNASTSGRAENTLLATSALNSDDPQVNKPAANFEPIKVIPGKATVNMVGMPLVQYGQQFYVDMGTGTTFDSIYRVTNIRHSLGPGNFTTSFDLTFVDSGGMSAFRTSLSAAVAALTESRN